MNLRVFWKPRACGRTEDFPPVLNSPAFFPGYSWADVNTAEQVVIRLDLHAGERVWAREIPRQVAALRELFEARGLRLVGIARVEVSDQLHPVWAALLKVMAP